MRKILLIAFVLISSMGYSQVVWDDFDNPENVNYFYFDGTGFDQSYANPNTGGINSSALCAEYIRNGGVQYDVIVMDPAGTNQVDDVSDYLSGAKKMTVKVFSPAAGLRVQITLENSIAALPTNFPTGRHSEYFDTTTVSGAWETLTFNFGNQPDPTVANTAVNRMVLLFEPGSNTSTTWIWDDLMGPEFINPCAGITPAQDTVDNIECQRNLSYDFTNGNLAAVANPVTGGVNASPTCAKFTKFPPPTNDGAFGGTLSFPFTTATYNKAHIQLYSPAPAQNFLMIFQDANGDVADTTFTTSSTTAWVDYEMDLSEVSSSITISKVVLLLNPPTATEDTIYYDNFTLSLDVGIDDNKLAQNLSIYPVPFQNRFFVESGYPFSEITVTDLTGKVLANQTGLNSLKTEIDASTFAPGLYFVNVRDNEGNAFSTKIIK